MLPRYSCFLQVNTYTLRVYSGWGFRKGTLPQERGFGRLRPRTASELRHSPVSEAQS
jgi:hypothetical protein